MAGEPDLATWEGEGKRRKRPRPRDEVQSRRRGRRWLIAGGVLVLLLLVLLFFAPAIAGRFAPAMVERSLSDSIEGEVEIDAISLSWFAPTRLTEVRLLDPQGGEVADVTAEIPVGVWRALTEAWWSRKHLELGRIVVSGDVNLIREQDGRTNLAKAIAPTGPDEPGGRDAFEGVLRLAGVNVDVAAVGADGRVDESTRSSLRGLKGDVAFDYDTRRGTELMVKGDLEAALAGEAAEAGSKMTVGVDVRGTVSAAGSLLNAKASARAAGVPVVVLDVLGGYGGALREAVGPRATAQAGFEGDFRAGEGQLKLESDGASADLRAKVIDGVLSVQEGAQARLASTAGLERLPAVETAFARAGQRVRVREAPGATLTVRSARVPIAPLLEKRAGVTELDLRSASLDLTIALDEMEGEVLLEEDVQQGNGAGGTDGAGGGMRVFSLQPVTISVSSPSLAQGLTVNASTAARIGSREAGTATIDLTATGLLTEEGRLALLTDAAPADGLNGTVTLTDVSSALVQPVVDALGQPIDVDEDIGPAISLSLNASAEGDVGGGELDAMPPTRLDLLASAERATIGGAFSLENGVLRTRRQDEGAGLTASLAAAGPLARRLGGGALANRLQGPMRVELQVSDLALPLSRETMLRDVQASVTATVSNAAFALAGEEADAQGQDPAASPVQVRQLRVSGTLSPQSPAQLDVEGSFSHEDSAFLARGQVNLTGAQSAAAVQEAAKTGGPGMLERLRPSGQIMITQAPGSLVQALGLNPEQHQGAAREIMLALRESLGQSADASITFDPGSEGKAPLVLVRASGSSAAADLSLAVREGAVAVREAMAQLTVSAGRATSLLSALGGSEDAPPATVAADVPLQATVQPVTIPFEGWLPRKGGDTRAVATVRAGGPVRLEGIQAPEQQVTLIVADLQAQAEAPVATLLAEPGQAAEPLLTRAQAALQNDQGQPVAMVNAEATIAPDRSLQQALLTIDEIDTLRIDQMLGREGAASGLLGDTATLRAALTPVNPDLSAIEVELLAPNISGAALAMEATEREVTLTEPAKITWVVQPPAANHLLGLSGSAPGALVEPLTARLNVNRLTLAVPRKETESDAARGPLAPDSFSLDATLLLDSATMRATQSELATLSGIRAAAASTRQPGAISFEVEVAGVAHEQGAQGASALRGTLSNIADARGVLTTDLITLDAEGALAEFPTALADALARQDGLLLAALGPTASLRVDATGLARDQGDLSASLSSPRAQASVAGYIQEDRFVTIEPMDVRLLEVHNELVSELAGSLPVVSSLQKTRDQAPGLVHTEGLQIPLDGDVGKLNGTITVDLGEVSFATRPVFGQFVKALGGEQRGVIGRRVDPFTVRVTNGVLEYDRYTLPIGEFSIQTRGRVDLVNRTMNVVTYVPLFALTDEAAGMLNTSIAGRLPVLDRATQVPIRTKGVIGSTKTEPDLELFLKERGKDLKNLPVNILEGIGKGIDDAIGSGKDRKPEGGGGK